MTILYYVVGPKRQRTVKYVIDVNEKWNIIIKSSVGTYIVCTIVATLWKTILFYSVLIIIDRIM